MSRERPILFSAPMVRALLSGAKTQTRRAVKPPRGYRWLDLAVGTMVNDGGHKKHISDLRCPYGEPGDRLWCKETWCPDVGCVTSTWYRATSPELPPGAGHRWRPSIHMPRWASRITLEITGVRVEHLGQLSDADAIAEGVGSVEAYRSLWSAINGQWEPELWVLVILFHKV